MNAGIVTFDEMRERILQILKVPGLLPEAALPVYLVRDLYGIVRIAVDEQKENNEDARNALHDFAQKLHDELKEHGCPAQHAVIYPSDALLTTLKSVAIEFEEIPGAYLVDRLMTGSGWWTVGERDDKRHSKRCALFSIKGGVGRSTTAAFLAKCLAQKGERVLVVDMDLESPGLSPVMLEKDRLPRFGVVDWFVESLVEQGDEIIDDVLASPKWVHNLVGDVRVAPAHGADPGEYMAKLGRVYVDTSKWPWTERLQHMISQFENRFRPTVTLIESRSGLNDIAAAAITDIDAEILLFATDTETNWMDYEILFRHWNTLGMSLGIRERLSLVSALTPQEQRDDYNQRFLTHSWDLFQNHLYDEVNPDNEVQDAFSFDMDEENAPHKPMVIGWIHALASGISPLDLDDATLESAYLDFVGPFFQRVLGRGITSTH